MDGMMEEMPARLFEEWAQYLKIISWEREQAMKKARKGR